MCILDMGLEKRMHTLPFCVAVPSKPPHILAKKSDFLVNIYLLKTIYKIFVGDCSRLCRGHKLEFDTIPVNVFVQVFTYPMLYK